MTLSTDYSIPKKNCTRSYQHLLGFTTDGASGIHEYQPVEIPFFVIDKRKKSFSDS